MKKRIVFLILVIFFICILTGCHNSKTNETTETSESTSHEFLITYDYGKLQEGKLTLLYDECYMINDLSKYGVKDLKAGDVVKITHTGNPKMALSYPGQIVYDENQIISVEVIKAKIVELIVIPVPGGGCDLQPKDEKNYTFPEYFIYNNEYISINNIYQNLKIYGTIPYNSTDNKILGLYSEDYDPSKIEEEYNFVSNDETLNKYFEELIEAMTYQKEGNYKYNFTVFDETGKYAPIYKHYIVKDGVEYIKFDDQLSNEVDIVRSVMGYLYTLFDDKYTVDNGKIRYEVSADDSKMEKIRKLYYIIELKIIDFFNQNKPLVNNGIYGNYKLSIKSYESSHKGAEYICFDNLSTKTEEDVVISYSKENLSFYPFFDDKNSLGIDEYVEKNIETASLIDIEGEYDLLSKMDNKPSIDNYQIYVSSDNGYQFVENEYTFNKKSYYVSTYPDKGCFKGEYILNIIIYDKDIIFNGKTLNDSFEEIEKVYLDLGFIKSVDNNMFARYIKDGIVIEIDKELYYISFDAINTTVMDDLKKIME